MEINKLLFYNVPQVKNSLSHVTMVTRTMDKEHFTSIIHIKKNYFQNFPAFYSFTLMIRQFYYKNHIYMYFVLKSVLLNVAYL